MSSVTAQVATENARAARVRRALCDSVRGAAVFAYCVRALVSVLCVCVCVRLAVRHIGRRCTLAVTAFACATTARKLRAQHLQCAIHIEMWRSCAHARDRWRVASCARKACSAYGSVTDALARRGPRAAIYIRAVRLARQ